MCNLAFQIYLDLYTVANLTFDPVLETRHFDKNKLFLPSYTIFYRRVHSSLFQNISTLSCPETDESIPGVRSVVSITVQKIQPF